MDLIATLIICIPTFDVKTPMEGGIWDAFKECEILFKLYLWALTVKQNKKLKK